MKPFIALIWCACAGAISVSGQTAIAPSPPVPSSANLAIDGVFTEWRDVHVIASDSRGDALGIFDISTVAARTNGATLYLRLDVSNAVNLQNGPEAEGKLILDLDLGTRGTLLIDFRGRSAVLNKDDSITPVSWPKIDFQCLPTYASNEFELKINLSDLGVSSGEEIRLNFSGSDALDEPVGIALEKLDLDRSAFRLEPAHPSSFRIVNLNTWRNGLADPRRSQSIMRILDACQARIWALQEEFDEIKFRDATDKLMAPDVTSIWSSGCAVITKGLELQQLPMNLDRAVGGLITISQDRHIVLISAHFKCCGFAGTEEDLLRIQQAQQVSQAISQLRGGQFGDIAKSAPVIVMGDYNLVGSYQPISVLQSAGLTELIVRCPGDSSAYTWRDIRPDPASAFWPGRLDWVMHDSRLIPLRGLILDTTRMSSDELSASNLSRDDSLASDHLALIAEFEFND